MDLDTIKHFMAGKKTFLIVASAFIALIISWSTGKMDNQKFIEDATALALATTIRLGIKSDDQIIPPEVQKDISDLLSTMKRNKNNP